jgi:hypothetical protein
MQIQTGIVLGNVMMYVGLGFLAVATIIYSIGVFTPEWVLNIPLGIVGIYCAAFLFMCLAGCLILNHSLGKKNKSDITNE